MFTDQSTGCFIFHVILTAAQYKEVVTMRIIRAHWGRVRRRWWMPHWPCGSAHISLPETTSWLCLTSKGVGECEATICLRRQRAGSDGRTVFSYCNRGCREMWTLMDCWEDRQLESHLGDNLAHLPKLNISYKLKFSFLSGYQTGFHT